MIHINENNAIVIKNTSEGKTEKEDSSLSELNVKLDFLSFSARDAEI
jgi:hypothetical protein